MIGKLENDLCAGEKLFIFKICFALKKMKKASNNYMMHVLVFAGKKKTKKWKII